MKRKVYLKSISKKKSGLPVLTKHLYALSDFFRSEKFQKKNYSKKQWWQKMLKKKKKRSLIKKIDAETKK